MKRRQFFTFVAGSTIALSLTLGVQSLNQLPIAAQTKTQLIVSAAASLTDVMKEIAALYQKTHPNVTVRYNFAASGPLQQQIENGAPADVFVSAAEKQMDALQNKGLLTSGTRRNLLTNRLVLIVPSQSSGVTSIRSLTNNQVKRIAIGDPRSVPAGQYTEQTLRKVGFWNALQPKFVLATNVRQVLQFVEAGNAQAGFVYATDAKTSNKTKVVQTIPASLHEPIVYPAAVISSSKNQTAARNFVQFLSDGQAKQVFQKYGFGVD